MEKLSKYFIFLALACVIFGCVVSLRSCGESVAQEQKETEIEQRLERIEIDIEILHKMIGQYMLEAHRAAPVSDTAVLQILDSVGAYYPEVIMAQYELESAKGKSKVFCRTNNLFGMKKAFKRETCRNTTATSNGYAEYRNWQLSVLDRVLWDKFHWKQKPTKDEYLAVIEKTYAEDPYYMKKIETISKKYK